MQSYSLMQSSLLKPNALDSLVTANARYGLLDSNLIQLHRFLTIIQEIFDIKYIELFQLNQNGEYTNHNPELNYRNFAFDYELWNHFNTVTTSAYPRKMPYYSVKNLFKEKQSSAELSFITYPLRSENKPLGVLILGGKSNGMPYIFQGMTARIIKNIIQIVSIGLNRISSGEKLVDSSGQILNYLIYGIFDHDAYTSKHSNTTAIRAEKTAKIMGCSEREIQILKWSAILHDIGKMIVPVKVLNKPNALSDSEWKIMQYHPEIGSLIIGLTTGLSAIAEIVYTHHEHYDGHGYPLGLAGDQIPLPGRILSVVDAYGAMTENRPYQDAKSILQAKNELMKCAGTHFDPIVVDKFLNILNTGKLITENIV